MRDLDLLVTLALNSYSKEIRQFDFFVVEVLSRPTYNFLPLVAIWFSLFFYTLTTQRRRIALEGLFAAFVALCGSQILQHLGPSHPRPVFDPDIKFVVPAGLGGTKFIPDYNSFPSDHSVLAFALTATIWRGSVRLGTAAALWSVAIICFARLYGGWHYLSDLIGGAVWGVSWVVIVARSSRWTAPFFEKLIELSVRFEAVFMACLLFLSYQLVTFFDDLRFLGGAIAKLFRS
jgi:undecaprenyl-diphosphatase